LGADQYAHVPTGTGKGQARQPASRSATDQRPGGPDRSVRSAAREEVAA
jgi:hypothetical protein